MQQECTVEDHVAEMVSAARAAYLQGQRDGHRLGFDEGYLTGFSEGTRSSAAFKSGEANGFVDGYLERISDEISVHWDEVAA